MGVLVLALQAPRVDWRESFGLGWLAMRIGVLADIHGNAAALRAVIDDMRAFAPDLVVNLGDHLSGPLEAAETADVLMSQKNWVHLRGNHDRQMVEQDPTSMGLSDRAAAAQVSERHRAWLASLPPDASVAGLFLCHGTPASDSEYLAEEIVTGVASLATAEIIRSRLGGVGGTVLCGHSHVPRFVRLDDATLVVNPGSVGLQAYYDSEHRAPHAIETGSPHARYALLESNGGNWRAGFRIVEYDWETAARRAEEGGRPEWAYSLRTGYAPRPR